MNKNYKKNGKKSLILVLAVLLMLSLNMGIAGAAIPVSSCITIAEPGTYELTTDIVDSSASSCIIITSSNVIFDGKYHTIDGILNSLSYGVIVNNPTTDLPDVTTDLTTVTVKNLTVTDWGNGIKYEKVTNGRIENNNVQSNNVGIQLVWSNQNILKNNTAAMTPFGGYGIGISSSNSNMLTRNRALNNGGTGIVLGGSSNYNKLVGNNASLNGDMGIWILENSNNNTLTRNIASGNGFCCGGGRAGILIETGNYTNLTSNKIKNNFRGVAIVSSNNIRLVNNVINNNNQSRIDVFLSSLIVI